MAQHPDADGPRLDERTGLLHQTRHRDNGAGAVRAPIHTSTQFGFEHVEDLIAVFQGRAAGGFNYARQGTPTTASLEALLTRLERGRGTVTFATGMAALTAMFLSLLRAGDHIVSSRYVFGNTNSLYGTLERLGIDVSRVDGGDVAAVRAALRPQTRMVFVETVANPGTQIPDLAGLGALCREHGLVYVVDNTVVGPALFRPRDVGASLVVHSLTKTIGGHGAALGGSVTDTGLFDWSAYPNIADDYRGLPGPQQGLQQLRKKGLRDLGATLAPEQAARLELGIDTLFLRAAQVSATALALARHLQSHPAIDRVHYPMLESHPQHELARTLFAGGGSWLLAFELKDPQRLVPVLDALRIPVRSTGLGDNRSLVIPVAPTIYWEMGPDMRRQMGIAEGLVRYSVGLEPAADLIADLDHALRQAG